MVYLFLNNYSAQEQGRQRAQEENERGLIELLDELERGSVNDQPRELLLLLFF